jgi:hypothetical protein
MEGREIDPQLLPDLSPNQVDDLAKLKNDIRTGKVTGVNATAYSRYLDDARNPSTQELFVTTNLQQARDAGDIDDIQLKTLESLQRSMKLSDPSVIKRLKKDGENSSLMEREWESAGHKLNPAPNSKEGKKYELFKTRAYEELESAESKGALDLDKKRAVIQRLLKNSLYESRVQSAQGEVGGQQAIPQWFMDYMASKRIVDPDEVEYWWSALPEEHKKAR